MSREIGSLKETVPDARPSIAGPAVWKSSSVNTLLRNAATAQETYFADHVVYSNSCMTLPGFNKSPGTIFSTCTGSPTSFLMVANHPQGSKTCTYDSTASPPPA